MKKINKTIINVLKYYKNKKNETKEYFTHKNCNQIEPVHKLKKT